MSRVGAGEAWRTAGVLLRRIQDREFGALEVGRTLTLPKRSMGQQSCPANMTGGCTGGVHVGHMDPAPWILLFCAYNSQDPLHKTM